MWKPARFVSALPLVFTVGGVHDTVALPVELPVPVPDPEPDPLVDPELDPDVELLEVDVDEVLEADELAAGGLASELAEGDDPEPPPQPASTAATAKPNMTLPNLINTPPRLGA